MKVKSKIAIIGGGISGISCANILKEKNIQSTLFEKQKSLGGLISCSIESGNIFHRVGGHVFNTKNQHVLNWFWNKFDCEKEFVKAKRNAVILINGSFINYPIELNINQLNRSLGEKVINELIELSKNKKISKSFEDFLFNNFGKTLYSIYFGKYNKKIWKRDLNKIPLEWLEDKLPMIKPQEILIQNIYSTKKDNMAHSSFYYPKKGGSQFIVERLSRDIVIEKNNINKISYQNKSLILNNQKEKYSGLIYTGDIRDIKNLFTKELIEELKIQEILNKIDLLESNSTSTFLCECDKNEYSWIYLPSKDIKPHRIIMTGNFSNTNNNKKIGKNRITCTVECSGEVKKEIFINELKKLPFNPKFITYNYCKNSYIIHNSKTKFLVDSLRKVLLKKNIFLCGRFAEWEYFNMDNAIESAMKICSSLESFVKFE